jgi:hypothetical protein
MNELHFLNSWPNAWWLWLGWGLVLWVFAYGTACLSFCFYQFSQPGMIFHFYRRWLDKHLSKTAFYKPLGACIYCFNVWLSLAVYVWWVPFPQFLAWQLIAATLFFCAVSNYQLRQMMALDAYAAA